MTADKESLPAVSKILPVLQHALGRDEYGRPERRDGTDYRNHFCAGEGSADLALCREAVSNGFMTEYAPREISGGDFIFRVTDLGKAFVTACSPKPPKLTRSQARYRAWIDADSGTPFREWLGCRR